MSEEERKRKHREYQRAYRERNLERLRERRRDFAASDAERSREYHRKHRDRLLEYKRDWRRQNPDYKTDGQHQIEQKLASARHRSPKRLTCPPVNSLEFASLAWECRICGGPAETLDHIVPVSRGGCAALHNLQWLCANCNHRKINKLMHEWLDEDEFMAWAERTHSGGCVHAGVN